MSPSDELVDLIDDAGDTVGVVTRREMRQRRLPHRCTYVLVFNTLGELFIHLRTPTKDVNPGCWDVCVGGVLSAGESFDLSARREVREEIGIDADPVALFPFRYQDDRTIVQSIVYRVIHDGPFTLQPEEIVRGEFAPIPEVLRRISHDSFCPDGVQVLREYLK